MCSGAVTWIPDPEQWTVKRNSGRNSFAFIHTFSLRAGHGRSEHHFDENQYSFTRLHFYQNIHFTSCEVFKLHLYFVWMKITYDAGLECTYKSAVRLIEKTERILISVYDLRYDIWYIVLFTIQYYCTLVLCLELRYTEKFCSPLSPAKYSFEAHLRYADLNHRLVDWKVSWFHHFNTQKVKFVFTVFIKNVCNKTSTESAQYSHGKHHDITLYQ